MTTIKFKRPDGEARLEWVPMPIEPDGGVVDVTGDYDISWHYNGRNTKALEAHLQMRGVVDPSPILLAAESLRNEKRALAKDGSEWRSDYSGGICAFSAPTFDGISFSWDEAAPSVIRLASIARPGLKEAALKWHRAAYFPLLKADECYPPGELPRKMTDDEVRFPDGSAGRMTLACGNYVSMTQGCSWNPSTKLSMLGPGHPAHDKTQLARLQAFWDRGQPKEDGYAENLRWSTTRIATVEFSYCGVAFTYGGGKWPAMCQPGPRTKAQVEAFFAKGPPVELAEDEFLAPGDGSRCYMRIENGRLCVSEARGGSWATSWSRGQLREHAASETDPNTWPRALAYFDRHVKPARVTDARFVNTTAHDGGTRVIYNHVGVALSHLRHQLDDAMRALEYERERAPDLTELREAWNSYMPGLAPLPDRVLPILLAAERLVGK